MCMATPWSNLSSGDQKCSQTYVLVVPTVTFLRVHLWPMPISHHHCFVCCPRSLKRLFLTMSRITSSTAALVEKAVVYMEKHPTLPTSLAMKLAGFSEEDQANPSKRRLVQRHLPGKAKRKMQALSSSNSSSMGSIIGKTVPGGGGFDKSSPSTVTDFSNKQTESDDAAAVAASLVDSPPANRFRLT